MSLPEIMIGKVDREGLAAIALTALRSERPPVAAALLLSELRRAIVVPDGDLPEGVVAVRSRVIIRDNIDRAERQVILVHPGEEGADSRRLSVLTPLGAALIGLSVGDSIEWSTATGDRRSITVMSVSAQRERLAPG